MSIWSPPRRWHLPSCYWQLSPPANIRDWLLESGSLTTRLVSLSEGHFRVELLRQYWAQPALEEARRLGMAIGRYALIREVALLGHDTPWVRARSVIPASSLQGAGQRLGRLGTRSLGHLLFRDPTLARGAIEIAQIQQPEGLVYARRSRFVYHGQPLLVAECFLPALLIHAANSLHKQE